MTRVPIFDLDGTLLDTDEALLAAFVALGVRREDVTFGHVLADECRRLDIDVATYLEHYDTELARPFPAVPEMLARLERWAVCSNKHRSSGRRELERLGWEPEVALFTDAFGGPKHLGPVLDALGVTAAEVVFIGDTAHDRAVAADRAVPFALAGWNPRAVAATGDAVLDDPLDVVGFCRDPSAFVGR